MSEQSRASENHGLDLRVLAWVLVGLCGLVLTVAEKRHAIAHPNHAAVFANISFFDDEAEDFTGQQATDLGHLFDQVFTVSDGPEIHGG